MTPYDRKQLVAEARKSIAAGSRSFAIASRLFGRTTRERVWLLYAWCRACDDIADAQELGHHHARRQPLAPGQHTRDEDAAAGLGRIRLLSDLAMAGKPTGDPAFDALGQLATEAPVTRDMVEAIIAGFALDAADWHPRTEADMLQYCYHVAGAVGVMMASVMGVGAEDRDTLARACDLGIAFQLSNIVRDVCDDDAFGRCYIPDEWLSDADIPPGEVTKPHYRDALVPLIARICNLARGYEASAKVGAARLPFRQRWAIFSAMRIYCAIGRKVEDLGAHAWDHRAYVPTREKVGHVARALGDTLRKPRSGNRPGPGLSEFSGSGGQQAR